MVFSSILASLFLFLCSVPGLGHWQLSFSRAHSVHLGRVSQQRFLRWRQVRHPIRRRLVTGFSSAGADGFFALRLADSDAGDGGDGAPAPGTAVALAATPGGGARGAGAPGAGAIIAE